MQNYGGVDFGIGAKKWMPKGMVIFDTNGFKSFEKDGDCKLCFTDEEKRNDIVFFATVALFSSVVIYFYKGELD